MPVSPAKASLGTGLTTYRTKVSTIKSLPISSNSSNGTESDFDFDDDDDDPYKLRNNFSHPGDVALRGLGTKWGEPTYSELKSNHIIFNPRSAHRADLSLPFTHNLETTRDARSLIYWRKGKPEKVGHTRDINRRCAAYKADDKLTIVADLDSIPLRVDEKLQHSLRELFKEIDEHPNIPQYYKDLWKVFSQHCPTELQSFQNFSCNA